MGPRTARLVPPLLLAVLVGVSVVSTRVASRRPLSRVYELTCRYADALRAGDVETALRLHAIEDPRARRELALALEARAETLRGRPWRIEGLAPEPDGSVTAALRWLPRDARGGDTWQLELRWVPGPDGTWHAE